MSPTPPPHPGLFESIFTQIWVSLTSIVGCDINGCADVTSSICFFQRLLRLGFWVPFLLSFMVFFAWGTFLSCQSYWSHIFWSFLRKLLIECAGWGQKGWGPPFPSSYSTRSRPLCRTAVGEGRKSSNQQNHPHQQQLRRKAPNNQHNLNLPSNHNLKSPHLSQTTSLDPHQAPQ